jgi:hypothetical protein
MAETNGKPVAALQTVDSAASVANAACCTYMGKAKKG